MAGVLPPAPAVGSPGADARFERVVIAQVNRARAAEGLGPVRVVPCVDGVAESAAVSLHRRGGAAVVEHPGTGRSCGRSLKLQASATGRVRPSAVVKGWMRDRGARSVLLSPGVRAVGVAIVSPRGRARRVALVAAGSRLRGDRRSVQPPTAGMDGLEAAILDETNRLRRKHGLRPLRPSRCATRFAGAHSGRMATGAGLVHADLGSLLVRCGGGSAAENIAMGTGGPPTARDVVRRWMSSPGHRANILQPGVTHLGVGVALDARPGRWYATQDFLSAS